MFNKPKSIETAFQFIRLFSFGVVLCSFAFCVFMAFESYNKVSAAQNKIYVIADGKAMEIFASDRKANIPVEAKDHIRTFHQYFFSLDPDEEVIKNNIGKALYLCDESANRLYQNLQETGYYAGIISGNISQTVQVDSVALSTDSYPYYFRCFCTEKIIRPTSTVTRDLVTEGYLRNIARSDHNPHGFLIERWSVIENKDLKTEAR